MFVSEPENSAQTIKQACDVVMTESLTKEMPVIKDKMTMDCSESSHRQTIVQKAFAIFADPEPAGAPKIYGGN